MGCRVSTNNGNKMSSANYWPINLMDAGRHNDILVVIFVPDTKEHWVVPGHRPQYKFVPRMIRNNTRETRGRFLPSHLASLRALKLRKKDGCFNYQPLWLFANYWLAFKIYFSILFPKKWWWYFCGQCGIATLNSHVKIKGFKELFACKH